MAGTRRVFFESWRGRYADSPRAISEYLAQNSDHQLHWVATDPSQLPAGTSAVRRHSPDYFRRLLTCDYLITNDIISKHLVKGPGVTYVQAWHGTPLKKIGLDETHASYSGAAKHLKRMVRDVCKWDYLISPSPEASRIFRSAFDFQGPILETGYPRNDVLHSAEADSIRERLRSRWDISGDQLVILYAPTWRDNSKDSEGRFRDPARLDLRAMGASLPPGTVLLNRMHSVVATQAPAENQGNLRVLDVSSHPDIAELYLAADVMISDYSSAVYDFAVTAKPIILFAYDLESYRDAVRGMYFDYHDWAPGPIATDSEQVIAELLALPNYARDYAGRYGRFTARFCPYEDGRATARVVRAVFGLS